MDSTVPYVVETFWLAKILSNLTTNRNNKVSVCNKTAFLETLELKRSYKKTNSSKKKDTDTFYLSVP